MKNIFVKLLALGTAAMSLAACTAKIEADSPVAPTRTVHFVLPAEIAQTKTAIEYDGGAYLPFFQKDDELGVLFAVPEETADLNSDVILLNSADDGESAVFVGDGAVLAEKDQVIAYTYYPAGKVRGYKDGTVGIDVPNQQAPVFNANTGYSFDPKADILIGTPAAITVIEESGEYLGSIEDNLQFARVTGILRISLNAASANSEVAGEIVKDLTIETSKGDIAGRIVVDLTNADYSKTNSKAGSQTIVVTPTEEARPYINYGNTYAGSNNIFVSVAPVTIPGGSTLSFTINTVDASTGKDSHKIVKEITLSESQSIAFESSKPTVFNLTIQDEEVEDPDAGDTNDYTGEWVIAGTDTEDYILSAYVSGNFFNAIEVEEIDVTNGIVKTYDKKAKYKVSIAKIATGDYTGLYTIQDANGKYLTASATKASGNNYMVGRDSPENGSYWSIANKDGEFDIIAEKVNTSYARLMRVNRNTQSGVASNPRFSCYTETSTIGSKVALYPYAKVVEGSEPAATPVITLENNTVTITCETEGATIYYNLGTTAEDTVDPTSESSIYDVNNKPVITKDSYIKAFAVAEGYENSEIAQLSLTYYDNSAAYYVKVTSTDDLEDGDYLIVYESGNVAFNGALETLDAVSNTIAVTIANNKIAATDETNASKFIIEDNLSKLKSASGKYIGVSSNSNGLKQEADKATYTNSFTIDNSGNAVIAAVFEGANMTLRYNSASNQARFRYFGSGQQAIQLYKLEDPRSAAPISWSAVTGTAGWSSSGYSETLPTLSNSENLAVAFASSEPEVASIDANGTVTVQAAGETIISATYDGSASTAPYKTTTAKYTLTVTDNRETVAAPTFSPAEGAVTKGTTVSINCTTTGAKIYYTTDGSNPTDESTEYSDPIVINAQTTIKAIAFADGYKASAIASATYTVPTTIADVIEGGNGSYTVPNVTVFAIKGNALILGDASGKMYAYKSNHGLNVGDVRTVSGSTTTTNNGVYEFDNPTFTGSSTTTVNHGTAVEFDSQASSLQTILSSPASAVYIHAKGTQSGRDITTAGGSVLYLSATEGDTDGKSVEVYGYIYFYSSNYSNFNFLVTSIKEDPTIPTVNVSPSSLSWEASEYGAEKAKTLTVKLNEAADPSDYSVNYTDSDNAWTITDNGTGIITVYPKAENTDQNNPKTLTLTISNDNDSSVSQEIECTQAKAGSGEPQTYVDVLTASCFAATSTNYTDFSNKTPGGSNHSSAIYAGNSAKTSGGGIQLRSKNSNSGIVTTTSGGKVKSVKITVESGSNTVDIYGKNSAYSAASDLYNSSTQGTKIGSTSTSATITISGDYQYIGIRSNSGALYLTSIEITWEN